MEDIKKAFTDLYGSWDELDTESKTFIVSLVNSTNKKEILEAVKSFEANNKNELLKNNKR